MGKAGRASLDDIKVKVKRGAASPCGPELVGYLGCLDGNSGSDTRCAGIRAALERCMATAPARPRKQHKPPLNYFLQQVGSPAARPRAPALGFSLRPALRARPAPTTARQVLQEEMSAPGPRADAGPSGPCAVRAARLARRCRAEHFCHTSKTLLVSV